MISYALAALNEPEFYEEHSSKTYDDENNNLLLFWLMYGRENKVYLSEKKLDKLLQASDLNHINKYGDNALLILLNKNIENNHNLLSTTQMDYVIEHSDLEQVNNVDRTALNYALSFNQYNLTPEQFETILNRSNTHHNYTTHIPDLYFFEYALLFQPPDNKTHIVPHLNFEQLNYLFNNIPPEHKELKNENLYYVNKILKAQIQFLEQKIIVQDKEWLEESLGLKTNKGNEIFKL